MAVTNGVIQRMPWLAPAIIASQTAVIVMLLGFAIGVYPNLMTKDDPDYPWPKEKAYVLEKIEANHRLIDHNKSALANIDDKMQEMAHKLTRLEALYAQWAQGSR